MKNVSSYSVRQNLNWSGCHTVTQELYALILQLTIIWQAFITVI